MKKILLFLSFILSVYVLNAQSKKEVGVQDAVKQLTAAMISGEKTELEAVASDHLSYGHSGGHVEGKTEFVEKIASGKSDFVTIDITEQTIDIIGKT